MFYFSIDAVSLDKRKLGLVSFFIEAFFKVQKDHLHKYYTIVSRETQYNTTKKYINLDTKKVL